MPPVPREVEARYERWLKNVVFALALMQFWSK